VTAASSPDRILIVEDDTDIANLLAHSMKKAGFAADILLTGAAVVAQVRRDQPSLLLLDVMLPGLDGLEVCRALRADPSTAAIPIIMITARADEADRIGGLELGADDYITKPFSTRELIARIRTAVRRVHAPARAEDAPIEIGEIRLTPAKRNVTKRGQSVHLTRKEYDILYCLMSRAGRVVSYAKLLTAVWGADCREEVEYLRTFIRQLRKKIEDDPSHPIYLLTDVYVGYRFADTQMLQGENAQDSTAGALSEGAREGVL
jgi:two-component system KDP operon response regulator KdpE